ncbi:short chain alcohol dehydrogenase [Ameyamaea chiangmaiensis NBRC 103196]|uniref:SDR family NAD(P)-dependent oxidoreductase n=1 Tax=Ameyamaea chiangmaiensis TaxID=442969 RepID=A0A850PDU4_9PROT|nr:SDR family NAD(P)-dependent oxidoreductase [Ameyamaea chiangmaiensis]MBS4074072.1 SDR family NAD(P)-dependent oxidoreductase [Ameyamaea chiangmaiensis]NVN40446.1 SDR family NAD(P)-dependent oxidoreductase [Ameyamaea chiangmaiensis]GBQ67352.1 short chain alcohol dehydrogenase [Ameyamaea chiangmaiensis NBRC 103196]
MPFSSRSSTSTARLAVLTGASGGIGRALIPHLKAAGFEIAAFVRPETPFDEAGVLRVDADLSAVASIDAACAIIRAWERPVHLLVHCAGVIHPSTVAALKAEQVEHEIAINLTAPAVLTTGLLPLMPAGAHIVFVNSMAGALALPGAGLYSATKFGLRALALSLGAELRPRAIRVSSIFPGAVETPMFAREMSEGGSILNFVSPPVSADAMARRIARLCTHPRTETFPSRSDGVFANLCLAMPCLLRAAMPILLWVGRRGQTRYRSRAPSPGVDVS